MILIINSKQSLVQAIGKLKLLWDDYKYISVKIIARKRSIDQNALQFHWYKEMEDQGDMKSSEYRNYCKYHFGMAIRAEEDEFFANTMRDLMRRHTYEDRIKMMSFIDVTSTFSSKQMTRYLDEVESHFNEKGFILTSRS